MNYKDYFKDKRIAIIGLGAHGEMIADIKFLLRNKANVSLFDIRSEERLKKYIMSLSVGGLQKLSFGKIDGEELINYDLIILSSEISQKSTFLKKAVQAGIQIDYSDILFFKLAPQVTFIGIIGICGKSTVMHLMYRMLKKSFLNYKDQGLFIIDPESMGGSIAHLKKIKKGDVIIVRIPEHLLDHYYHIRMSPHVAIITSSIPLKILEFQTYNNFIIASDDIVDEIRVEANSISKAKILRTRASSIPRDWGIEGKIIHNQENCALAIQASELFKVSKDIMKDIIHDFFGLRGHIELIKKVGGIDFYNDSASVSPNSTLSAIKFLSINKKIIAILGGAYTGYDYTKLIKDLPQFVSTLILLPGSGTIGFRNSISKINSFDTNIIQVLNLEEAVKRAKEISEKGDIVLFSPGFNAVGIDISRRERGERFVKAVRGL